MIRSRLFHAIFALPLVLSSLTQAQEPRPRQGQGGTVLKTSLDFAKHLDGPAKWPFGEVGTLTLKMEGDSTVFLLNETQEVFRLNGPEYVDEAVPGEDGKSLVLVVMKSRGAGSDYATLLRVRPAGDPEKLEVTRVLESGTKLFDGRDWWIAEFGVASADGSVILARFGVEEKVPDGSRMHYQWYTMEVATGKILGEGLTIANGKREVKK